jgi:predicted O-linked N-acetylglucosamine transferase (SPINDLY family)
MERSSSRVNQSAGQRPLHAQFHSTSPDHSQGSPAPSASQDEQRPEQQIQLAIQALRAGRLQDAEAYLHQALRQVPEHPLAHNCLGIVMRGTGRLQQAMHHYHRAIQADPEYAEAHNNLGIVLESMRQHEMAVDSYRRSLQVRPSFAAARNNLGNALTKLGKAEEALHHFDEALKHRPDFPAAHNNKGLALREMGRLAEAETSYRRAAQHNPTFAEAYVNLGNLQLDAGNTDTALECFRLALKSKPKLAAAHVGLGNALASQSLLDEAIHCYQRALQIDARSADAHFGLGRVRKEQGNLEEAIACYREAIVLNPQFPEAHNNLGNAYASQGDLEAAIAAFKQAVSRRPDYLPAYNNLGNLYRMQERFPEAAACYQQVLERKPSSVLGKLRISSLCPTVFHRRDEMQEYYASSLREWTSLENACRYRDVTHLLLEANEPPFNLQFSAENIRPLKEAYARIFRYEGPGFETWRPSGRLRIGMVVTAQHEIAFLRLIWDALKRLDRDEFELTILSTARAVSKFRASIPPGSAELFPIPDRPDQIVEQIRTARFDVLYYFEIGTDALNYFLPFFRLAPVQCTSWGIQVTSGIPNVDYYLSSRLVEPEDAQEHYSEELVCGETLLAYQVPIAPPSPVKSRSAFGFDASQHLYLCAQHLGKFHHDFDPVMAEILRRDPAGRIVITKDRYGYGANILKQRIEECFADVAPRVVFLPRQALPDYISLVSHADVMLDPTHFGGVNTTYDALALDKPIITMPSGFHRGRYTAGCLQRIGLDDCIASDQESYVQQAVALGTDRDYHLEIAERIRETKHRIFRDQEAVHEHERIFRALVDRCR